MAVATQVAPSPSEQASSTVNDFVINVATANGTGSQTSNIVILRTLFKMGIPDHGQESVPQQYSGAAHLVHHPPEQGGLSCPPRRHGHHGVHERGDRGR